MHHPFIPILIISLLALTFQCISNIEMTKSLSPCVFPNQSTLNLNFNNYFDGYNLSYAINDQSASSKLDKLFAYKGQFNDITSYQLSNISDDKSLLSILQSNTTITNLYIYISNNTIEQDNTIKVTNQSCYSMAWVDLTVYTLCDHQILALNTTDQTQKYLDFDIGSPCNSTCLLKPADGFNGSDLNIVVNGFNTFSFSYLKLGEGKMDAVGQVYSSDLFLIIYNEVMTVNQTTILALSPGTLYGIYNLEQSYGGPKSLDRSLKGDIIYQGSYLYGNDEDGNLCMVQADFINEKHLVIHEYSHIVNGSFSAFQLSEKYFNSIFCDLKNQGHLLVFDLISPGYSNVYLSLTSDWIACDDSFILLGNIKSSDKLLAIAGSELVLFEIKSPSISINSTQKVNITVTSRFESDEDSVTESFEFTCYQQEAEDDIYLNFTDSTPNLPEFQEIELQEMKNQAQVILDNLFMGPNLEFAVSDQSTPNGLKPSILPFYQELQFHEVPNITGLSSDSLIKIIESDTKQDNYRLFIKGQLSQDGTQNLTEYDCKVESTDISCTEKAEVLIDGAIQDVYTESPLYDIVVYANASNSSQVTLHLTEKNRIQDSLFSDLECNSIAFQTYITCLEEYIYCGNNHTQTLEYYTYESYYVELIQQASLDLNSIVDVKEIQIVFSHQNYPSLLFVVTATDMYIVQRALLTNDTALIKKLEIGFQYHFAIIHTHIIIFEPNLTTIDEYDISNLNNIYLSRSYTFHGFQPIRATVYNTRSNNLYILANNSDTLSLLIYQPGRIGESYFRQAIDLGIDSNLSQQIYVISAGRSNNEDIVLVVDATTQDAGLSKAYIVRNQTIVNVEYDENSIDPSSLKSLYNNFTFNISATAKQTALSQTTSLEYSHHMLIWNSQRPIVSQKSGIYSVQSSSHVPIPLRNFFSGPVFGLEFEDSVSALTLVPQVLQVKIVEFHSELKLVSQAGGILAAFADNATYTYEFEKLLTYDEYVPFTNPIKELYTGVLSASGKEILVSFNKKDNMMSMIPSNSSITTYCAESYDHSHLKFVSVDNCLFDMGDSADENLVMIFRIQEKQYDCFVKNQTITMMDLFVDNEELFTDMDAKRLKDDIYIIGLTFDKMGTVFAFYNKTSGKIFIQDEGTFDLSKEDLLLEAEDPYFNSIVILGIEEISKGFNVTYILGSREANFYLIEILFDSQYKLLERRLLATLVRYGGYDISSQGLIVSDRIVGVRGRNKQTGKDALFIYDLNEIWLNGTRELESVIRVDFNSSLADFAVWNQTQSGNPSLIGYIVAVVYDEGASTSELQIYEVHDQYFVTFDSSVSTTTFVLRAANDYFTSDQQFELVVESGSSTWPYILLGVMVGIGGLIGLLWWLKNRQANKERPEVKLRESGVGESFYKPFAENLGEEGGE